MLQDSEQQMILTARRSLVAKVARHQAPQIDIFFLNILVRRSHLVCDSLNEVGVHPEYSPTLKFYNSASWSLIIQQMVSSQLIPITT